MRNRRMWLLSVVGMLIMPSTARTQGGAGDGLKAEITGVSIPANRRPVVSFKITDANGKPLDVGDLDADSVKFTIAALKTDKSGNSDYQNYILAKVAGKDFVFRGEARKPALAETLQPGADQGGVLAKQRPGAYTYTFKTALTVNFARSATHVVGGEMTRGNRKFAANPLFEFIPAGGKIRVRRAVVETASCNNCHDPLKYHDGARRETGYCGLCHTSQLTDPETGQSLEFKVLVHKIHRGKLLPSVREGKPFYVVGAGQQLADYTNLRYPQVVTTEGVHKDLRNCKACHTGSAPQGDNWKKFPAVAPCTACHDNVDLKSGKNHLLGPQTEGTCSGCHLPEGPEFGPSSAGAHAFPGWSTQLPGVVFEILKIEDSKPGQNPIVTFSVKNKKGEPLNAAQMNNLRLVLAWPTIDYEVDVDEDARKADAQGNGVYKHRFKYMIPSEATGSGAIGIQGFKNYDLKKPNGSVIKGQRDAGDNVVKYFPITDRNAVPRRKVVKTENCNVCHNMLAIHGEARRNTEFCVMCHNAGHTDKEKRKTANGPMPAENVHYKRLIHRIHTGINLGEPFIVYGGPPAKPGPIEFGDIRFPGDRRNCTKCHEKGAKELPLPDGVLATQIPQLDGTTKPLTPIMSACVGCHNKEPAKAHMEAQIASVGRESCVVCHGAGREFAVDKTHRR